MSVETALPRRRFRLTLGLVMVFVVAAASASALGAKAHEVFQGWISDYDVDVTIVLVLGVVLSAVAIGGWRRHSAARVLWQIAIACALILVPFELSTIGWYRGFLYWFQATFALTVAGPLLVRQAFLDPDRPGRGRGLVELLLCCGLNLLLVGLGLLAEILLAEFFS